MWFDADPEENTDGFPDLIKHAHLMAWLCLFGFIGFAMWMVLP